MRCSAAEQTRAADDAPADQPRDGWSSTSGVAGTAGVNAAIALLGAATGILTARALGPEGRGAVAVAVAVSALAAVIANAGLQQSLTYLVAQRPKQVRHATRVAIWVGAAAGALMCLSALALAPAVVTDPELANLIQLAAVAIPPTILTLSVIGILQGLRLGLQFNTARLLFPSFYLIALASGLLVEGTIEPSGVLVAYVAAAISAAFLAFFLLPKEGRSIAIPRVDFTVMSLRYGRVAAVSAVAVTATSSLAVPFVGLFGGLSETGQFAVGFSFAIPVGTLAAAIAFHTLPDTAAAKSDARRRLLRSRFRVTVLTLIPIALVAVLSAGTLVPLLFGSEFSSAIGIAQILVAAQCLRALAYVLSDYWRGIGRPGRPAMADSASLGVLVLLLPLMVSAAGAVGAAVSIVAANLTLVALLLPSIRSAHLVDELAVGK